MQNQFEKYWGGFCSKALKFFNVFEYWVDWRTSVNAKIRTRELSVDCLTFYPLNHLVVYFCCKWFVFLLKFSNTLSRCNLLNVRCSDINAIAEINSINSIEFYRLIDSKAFIKIRCLPLLLLFIYLCLYCNNNKYTSYIVIL